MFSKCSKLALVGIVVSTGISAAAQSPVVPPLSANDVSWLFPPPTHAADLDGLISMGDLTVPNAQDRTKSDHVWPDSAFRRFLDIAASPAAQVGDTSTRIGLPEEAKSIGNWFVAGVRIDAGAPGLSPDIRNQFGQSPQIRLIVQLITRKADGTPEVHDIAGHLVFDFLAGHDGPAQDGCAPRPTPDMDAFGAIVAELAAIRTKLGDGQLGANRVKTSDFPLGVHPGLKDPTTASALRREIKSFLEKHISGRNLDAMAMMGLPAGAPSPWIFLAMARTPNGDFVPVPGPVLDGQQFAQMLAPVGTRPRVVPVPHPNNRNPITCKNAAVPTAVLPVSARSGSSTADLFAGAAPATTKEILDLIADPARSHFFNTDCVSCHTETRRAMDLLQLRVFEGIDTAVLPNGDWNVRNFGWSPPSKGQVQATVSRRSANETAAVVAFINSMLLAAKQR